MAELDEDLMELEEDTQKGRYLTFTLGKEYYGIEIRYVTEIIGLQPITQVPDLSDYVKGVINLRGRIIPVMDVRLRFKKEEIDYDDRTCIIVIDINKMFIGLVVDRVSEVVNISEENISAPPNLGNSHHNKYIKGIGKIGEDVKLILDCDKLLNDEEYAVIEQSI
ncbi:MAG: chemotaxis protein CheW [Deltaproteobacteria bacterium]